MNRTGSAPRRAAGRPWLLACAFGTAALACSSAALAVGAAACTATSGPTAVHVVELYTSEGCSSCPPADRWLSRLQDRPDVVGLAFHVDYWDRLGWKDRFASPVFTRRQAEQQAINGARFSYTPQVVVDGQDRKDWPRWSAAAARMPAPVGIVLRRRGQQVVAEVTPTAEAPRRLAAYWAVTEFGHRTVVKAGENDGATLEHDFIVRVYQPVAAWTAAGGASRQLDFAVPMHGDAGHARRVTLVVVDGISGRPLQALALRC